MIVKQELHKIWSLYRNGRLFDQLHEDRHAVNQVFRSYADDWPSDLWELKDPYGVVQHSFKPVRQKLKSHVGMNYMSPAKSLFTFQLLDDAGYAVANVDMVDGRVDTVRTTRSLMRHHPGIVKLAELHCKRVQG